MVILRLHSQNRMVTKGYRKGVYDWVGQNYVGQTLSRSGPAELDSGLVWRGAVARVTPALALFRSAPMRRASPNSSSARLGDSVMPSV
jgi:hypothetical protein